MLRRPIYEVIKRQRVLIEVFHGKETVYNLENKGIWNEQKTINSHKLSNWIREMFLPVGFPNTVHRSYFKVHLWQFVETLAGSIISVLTAEAMLSSVGANSPIGSGAASVAIQWTLKDGFGEMGKLLFIQRYSYLFDSLPRTWKCIGEIASVTGAGCQMLTIFFPSQFLLFASLGYALRGVHYSIWSATHTTFNNLSAIQGNNIGDLVAKDDSQLSLAHLCGLGIGVSILSFSTDVTLLMGIYMVISACQLYMTYALVKAADFEVLNFPRMRLICKQYVDTGFVPSCLDLKSKEHWLGEWNLTHPGLVKIRMCQKVQDIKNDSYLSDRLEILKDEKYLLAIDEFSGEYLVLLHQDATGQDVLRAILHGSQYNVLEYLGMEGFYRSYEWSRTQFPPMYERLEQLDWNVDSIVWSDNGVRVRWRDIEQYPEQENLSIKIKSV
ncbi:vitamin B6 photo-protection and homoeostasis-domain-containing protein [Globomyces pollinis-pini]|nr:vitamin B6 photo-protection and homoeostasis-domain-containing protein [Globomyces pollinis-pini]